MGAVAVQSRDLDLVLVVWRRGCAGTVGTECRVGTAEERRLCKLEWGRVVRRGWWIGELLEVGVLDGVGERLWEFRVAEVWQRVVVEIPAAGSVATSVGEWLRGWR